MTGRTELTEPMIATLAALAERHELVVHVDDFGQRYDATILVVRQDHHSATATVYRDGCPETRYDLLRRPVHDGELWPSPIALSRRERFIRWWRRLVDRRAEARGLRG